MPVGRADVGFLPGGLEEKLDPWMSAIHDAIVALTDRNSSNDARRLIDELTAYYGPDCADAYMSMYECFADSLLRTLEQFVAQDWTDWGAPEAGTTAQSSPRKLSVDALVELGALLSALAERPLKALDE